MADQKFKTLAAAAAAADKQGIPYSRIYAERGGYWIRWPKPPRTRKSHEPIARDLAEAQLSVLGYLRVGDSDTYVRRLTGKRAWLTPAGRGMVTVEAERGGLGG